MDSSSILLDVVWIFSPSGVLASDPSCDPSALFLSPRTFFQENVLGSSSSSSSAFVVVEVLAVEAAGGLLYRPPPPPTTFQNSARSVAWCNWMGGGAVAGRDSASQNSHKAPAGRSGVVSMEKYAVGVLLLVLLSVRPEEDEDAEEEEENESRCCGLDRAAAQRRHLLVRPISGKRDGS